MKTTPQSPVASALYNDEKVLVIETAKLFQDVDRFSGLQPKTSFEDYEAIIAQHKQFMPRMLAEENFAYKQICSYLVFKHKNRFFLMQRKSTASEQRLQDRYTLGIGGHLREEDMVSNRIQDWIYREFEEEVDYEGSLSIVPLGVINDDRNAVGQVHIGFVFLLVGSSDHISVKSELKEGKLLTLDECVVHYDKLESWSMLIVDYLRNQD